MNKLFRVYFGRRTVFHALSIGEQFMSLRTPVPDLWALKVDIVIPAIFRNCLKCDTFLAYERAVIVRGKWLKSVDIY